ncbi:hypothetical protein [Sporosarcina gallistercoris]|uniref:Uncharacterized protein n=1 Tax=Sporosarcina gallistercoris TaxID=2762245 RepID=A0ABR8PIS9_9BACL|nr:hypothetical protein [Sporosarcina gallistercoris]MBD7908065.1 hypothetical protein [Sporosarcina gallistercoris]
MLLHKGVTGFQPTLYIEESEFKMVCYSSFGTKSIYGALKDDTIKQKGHLMD